MRSSLTAASAALAIAKAKPSFCHAKGLWQSRFAPPGHIALPKLSARRVSLRGPRARRPAQSLRTITRGLSMHCPFYSECVPLILDSSLVTLFLALQIIIQLSETLPTRREMCFSSSKLSRFPLCARVSYGRWLKHASAAHTWCRTTTGTSLEAWRSIHRLSA